MNRALAARYLPFAVLLFGLTLSPVMPELSSVGFFSLAAVGLFLIMRRHELRIAFKSPAVLLPLIAGALILLALLITTREPSNLVPVVLFMPLILIAPVATVLGSGRKITADHIALFALVGSFAAMALALIDSRLLGIGRAGQSVNNPIHFAAVSVVIGFIALAGLYAVNRFVRMAALLGPLFGLVAAALSGSRGPLLAFPVMLVVVLLVLLFQRVNGRQAWVITAGLVVLGVGTLIWMWQSPLVSSVPGIGDVILYLRDGAVRDSSSGERAAMYQGGLRALMDSPWFGHGANFVGAAAELSANPATFPRYEHLHSDLLDFGALAGALGLAAYALFIAAAPVSACRLVDPKNRGMAQLVAFPVAAGYLVLGLTNATIGVIAQTIVLAVVCALVTYLSPAQASKATP